MSIVNSSFALGTIQRDGRRFVSETHTDNIGLTYVAEYLAEVGANYASILAARAPQIAEQIAQGEFEANINRISGFTLNYGTKAEQAARFRAAYQAATKEQVSRMAYWIIERINDGTFSDAQVQNAFGLTAGQYASMKGRATTLHDHWAAVLVAVGE